MKLPRRLSARGALVVSPPEDLPAWPGYTVGSFIVFPGNKVGGKMTINGAADSTARSLTVST